MSKDISLIMYSHSSYSDVWPIFFSQTEKYLSEYKKAMKGQQLFAYVEKMRTENKIAWADVQHVIDYKAEVSVGDILEIDSKLTKIGNKSITIHVFF